MNNKEVSALQIIYEECIKKIGQEKRMSYYASSFEDLYIMVKIEHDGVFDMATIDFISETVDICVYDQYKFILQEHLRMNLGDFFDIINDMSNYWDNILVLLTKEE